MKGHNINLTSAEMSGLWKHYQQNTAVLCVVKHFMRNVQDSEIRPILKEQIRLLKDYIDSTKKIFSKEDFPVPHGFSNEDVDLSAPALYTDLYALSFVYRFNQMALSDYSVTMTKVAREDVLGFYHECLKSTTHIYHTALNVMLSKGIYDRPPKMSYPDKVQFMEKQESFLSALIGKKTSLNALEFGEIFFAIERNCIGMLMLMGFIQVINDKEIKEYLIRGKELSQKQIDYFNNVLREEEHIGNIPVSMEVTDSRVSPFSDRLILFLVSITTTTGVYLSAYSMSLSLRKDLVTQYSLFMAEIMKYGGDGLKIMIERGWMEQPPQTINRKVLYKV